MEDKESGSAEYSHPIIKTKQVEDEQVQDDHTSSHSHCDGLDYSKMGDPLVKEKIEEENSFKEDNNLLEIPFNIKKLSRGIFINFMLFYATMALIIDLDYKKNKI